MAMHDDIIETQILAKLDPQSLFTTNCVSMTIALKSQIFDLDLRRNRWSIHRPYQSGGEPKLRFPAAPIYRRRSRINRKRSHRIMMNRCVRNAGRAITRRPELLLCDKCDEGYHLYCLRPILAAVPKGSWFCPSCSPHIDNKPKSICMTQTKIVDFFRIQRCSQLTEKLGQDFRKKRKRSTSLGTSKKKRKLLPFSPSEDSTKRFKQMQSLAAALTATGADYSNELTYMPGMAPRSANCPTLEREGMQVMSKEDTDTLNLCKSMMERGEWPPLMVVFDPVEGFTVEADKSIRDLTIITEYVGDVDYLEKREDDYDGDSMMTLLCAADSSKSLVICPDKRSNIARFINGINNHSKEGKKKQNVKCVRYDVNGEARVLLIACRDIHKGERLYYDYNGYENKYPTEHFV